MPTLTPTVSSIFNALEQRQQLAIAQRQRSLVLISGAEDWCRQLAVNWLQQQTYSNPLWVGSKAPNSYRQLPAKKCRQLLGTDIDLLIYDAWEGFDPDAFAAASGALKGGGLLLLLTPSTPSWPCFADPDYQRLLVHPYPIEAIKGRFIRFFQRQVLQDKATLVIEQGKALLPSDANSGFRIAVTALTTSNSATAITTQLDSPCLSNDQLVAVAAIKKVATGHTRRPLVITADRGRGKSSALGIACGQLLQQGIKKIIVTAPRVEAVQAVFQRAHEILLPKQPLTSANQPQTELEFNRAHIQFVAVDELLRNQPDAQLVLVDEAAAIPVPQLSQLLGSYNRLVFSSTVHGYEGTGKGFHIRFRQRLNQQAAQWKAVQLSQAIRWADNDPLERCVFNALLLNAEVSSNKALGTTPLGQCVIERIDRDQLVADVTSLKALFGLLLSAHYQTSPSDLRNLLDGPNISVWVSRHQGSIVAAAIVSSEGGFDQELALSVWKNQRRPKGHLLPQTLASHMGLQQAPQLRYLRVMRIAVQPSIQRQGLATQLMVAITQEAKADSIDFVGSSFAATADVLAFWRKAHCHPVRLGVSEDASSGSYSAIVLSALSPAATNLFTLARQRFNQTFNASLLRRYQQLDATVVRPLLLADSSTAMQPLDDQDYLDINAFTQGYREYGMVEQPLAKLVCLAFAQQRVQQQVSEADSALLIRRVLQNQPLQQLVNELGISGKKELAIKTREAVVVLVGLYQ